MGRNVKIGGRVLRDVVVGVSMLVLGLLIAAKLEQDNRRMLAGGFVVVDGDTLLLKGERLRLEGIDAPELDQVCSLGERAIPCGKAARRRLALWTEEAAFSCGGGERDRYGRLLVRCSVGDADVNAAMVRDGHAVAYGDYGGEEAAAKQQRVGLWAGEFQRPDDWRREHQPSEATEAGEVEPIARFWAFLRGLLGVN
ncbi:MAG: thermonuclease family protein [Rhizobium sp.]|nr:thermonuclease family protein [Rhizobium sp.]